MLGNSGNADSKGKPPVAGGLEAVLRPKNIQLEAKRLPKESVEDLRPPAKIRRLEKFPSCVDPDTSMIQPSDRMALPGQTNSERKKTSTVTVNIRKAPLVDHVKSAQMPGRKNPFRKEANLSIAPQ